MMPQDDAYWPPCGIHGDTKHWCDWTRQVFVDMEDAKILEPMTRICVPVIPAFDLFAEVSIGNEVIPNRAYNLALVIEDSTQFDPEDTLVELGLWMQGEGRITISTSLVAWADGYSEDVCKKNSHGFEEEMKLQADMKGDPVTAVRKNAWCMAYYKSCFFCYTKPKKANNIQMNFDASSFGLDPTSGLGGGGVGASISTRRTSRDQAVRNSLNARFGR